MSRAILKPTGVFLLDLLDLLGRSLPVNLADCVHAMMWPTA